MQGQQQAPQDGLLFLNQEVDYRCAHSHAEGAMPDRTAQHNLQAVQEQLLSQAGRKNAAQMESEEQVRRVTETRSRNVQDELLSKADLKSVKAMEDEERTRRMTEERHHDLNQELLSKADLKEVKEMEAEEQARRIAADLQHDINQQIHSKFDLKEVKKMEDEARTERIAEDHHHDVMQELESKADLQVCKRMEEGERSVRLQGGRGSIPNSMIPVQEEMMHVVNSRSATAAVDEEQYEQSMQRGLDQMKDEVCSDSDRERTAAMERSEAQRRMREDNPVAAEQFLQQVCEQVRSVGDRKTAAILEEQERTRRIAEENLHRCTEELLSKADLAQVKQMADRKSVV